MELYPYQVEPSAKLLGALNKYGHAINKSDMGTGKTICAAWIAAQMGRPTFGFCRSSLVPAWEKALREFGVDAQVRSLEKTRLGKDPLATRTMRKIRNLQSGKIKEVATFKFNLPKDTLCIWDEVQDCKSHSSLSSKLLAAAKPYTNLLNSASACETPLDMKSIGYILGLHNYTDFWRWAQRHGCSPGFFGGFEFDNDSRWIDKIQFDLRDVSARIRIEDLGKAFVKNLIVHKAYDLGARAAKLAKAIQGEVHAFREKYPGTGEELPVTLALRERQELEMLRLPVMLEILKECLDEGNSVLVFCNFTHSIQWLYNETKKYGAVTYDGNSSPKEKQKAIDAFQSGEARVFIANEQAGGTGLSLGDTSGTRPRTSLISPDFDARKVSQTIGRHRRADSKTDCRTFIIYAAGTIEERACDEAVRKLRQQSVFNDGERVVSQRECHAQSDSGNGKLPAPSERPASVYPDSSPILQRTERETPAVDSRAHSSITLDRKDNTMNMYKMTETDKLRGQIVLQKGKEDSPEYRAHARFSPSMMNYLELCPGYRSSNEKSFASERGTKLHDATERGDTRGLPPEESEAVQLCIDRVTEFVKPESKLFKEIRVNVLSQFGFLDAVVINHDEAFIFDYKYGTNKVPDAETNKQGWSYMLGVWDEFQSVRYVTVEFLMPFLGIIMSARFDREKDYKRVKLALQTIVARAEANIDRNPGDHCLYCSQKATCTALHTKVLTIAPRYDNLELPAQLHSSMITDPKQMALGLKLANIMEAWAKSFKQHATEMRLGGTEVPGYDLVERASTRKVTIPQVAWELLRDRFGVSPEEFSSCAEISWTNMEKLVASKSPRGGKEAAKEMLENALTDAGAMEQARPTHFLKKTK